MIILNELILKLNEKWYDRCRTGKEAKNKMTAEDKRGNI